MRKLNRIAIAAHISCWCFLSSCPMTLAETVVTGSSQKLEIQASNASLSEILQAVNEKAGFNLESQGALKDTVTGTFTGSLDTVLHRILQGHQYIVTTSGSTKRILILGTTGQEKVEGRPMTPVVAAQTAGPRVQQPIQSGPWRSSNIPRNP